MAEPRCRARADDAVIDELLAAVAADLEPCNVADPGPGEPPEQAVTRLGDTWVLANPRAGPARLPHDTQRRRHTLLRPAFQRPAVRGADIGLIRMSVGPEHRSDLERGLRYALNG